MPSSSSRLAPPPVEMWPKASSSKPSCRTAAAESPPPTTDSPSTSVSACATALVPSANAGVSKTPHYDEFDFLMPCHNAPCQAKELLPVALAGAEAVLSGTMRPQEGEDPWGRRYKKYDFGRIAILTQ